MSWLKLEDGSLVNLDHIESIEIIDSTPVNFPGKRLLNFYVVLFPAKSERVISESIKACEGSKSKCEDYMQALQEWVGAKKIEAFGEHQCQCECGCKEMIREGFRDCDACSYGDHFNHSINLQGDPTVRLLILKKDAA